MELKLNDPIASLQDAAAVQEGVLSCQWGSRDWSDPSLGVHLIPEAADVFANYLDEAGVVDAYGDSSVHSCGTTAGIALCQAAILVGSTWLDVDARGPFGVDDLRARFEAIVPELVATVGTVDVLPTAWSPEVSPLTSEYMWGESATLVAAAFGTVDAVPSPYDEIGALAGIVWDRSGFSMVPFDIGSGVYVTVTTLPGGTWAAVELEQSSPGEPVAIAGAEHATMTTTAERSTVCFSARGAGICVDSRTLEPDTLLDGVRAFVDRLPAA